MPLREWFRIRPVASLYFQPGTVRRFENRFPEGSNE